LKALAQAEEFTNNNPSQAKTIVKNQMNYTDSHMETVWNQNQFSLSLDQPLVSALEGEARWMIRNNLTNQTNMPNFLNNIYLNGLMSVKPESVNIIH
jgi:NitT/TauT family transport system substrate-binding protein